MTALWATDRERPNGRNFPECLFQEVKNHAVNADAAIKSELSRPASDLQSSCLGTGLCAVAGALSLLSRRSPRAA
jgi:hypothetical protein